MTWCMLQRQEVRVVEPLADLLIFACARLNDLEFAHDDEHFDALAGLDA